MKLIKLLLLSFVLILLQGCLDEGDKVSLSVEKGKDPQTPDPTVDSNLTPQVQTNLTFTPKGANAGDAINLGGNLSLVVTVTNSGSEESTGTLSASSKIELIATGNLTQDESNVSYTLAPGASEKFLVVRKSDFTTSLNESISIDGQNVASVTSSALGYSIVFWFTPRDISITDVNDVDGSADVSDGDTLNIMHDRSGNNFHLTADNANSLAVVSADKVNFNSTYTDSPYSFIASNTFGIQSADNFAYLMHIKPDNTTGRQSFQFHNEVRSSNDYKSNYGIDFNTYQTSGTKHGAYLGGTSYDVLEALDTNAHNIVLSIGDSTANNLVNTNSQYFVDNVSKSFSQTYSSGSVSNNLFSSYMNTANRILFYFDAIASDVMIIHSSDITASELEM